MTDMRIGHGYDVHRFISGRPLMLGGIEIPSDMGLEGHSDADVLIHAVMDALLGAVGLDDIGHQFPDSDGKYKNIDSKILLEKVADMIAESGYAVSNIDCTVIAQKPKLAGYINDMEKSMAECLGISADRVNVKATTEEHLGFTGRCEGIAAHAVCLLIR